MADKSKFGLLEVIVIMLCLLSWAGWIPLSIPFILGGYAIIILSVIIIFVASLIVMKYKGDI